MNKQAFKAPRNKNDLTGVLAGIIKEKRVSIFIDSANLYFAANVANLRIDYGQLYTWFEDKSKLTKANYYTAFDPEDNKQELFLQELSKEGFEIIKKPIKVYENTTKGNMDIELAVDALMQKDKYDILILVSGDGDFTYLLQALEKLNKQVIVLGIGGFTSFELHQEASNYFFLNRISKVWQPAKKLKNEVDDYLELPKIRAQDKIPESVHAKDEIKSLKKHKDAKSNVLNEVISSQTTTQKSQKHIIPNPKSNSKIKPPVKVKVKQNKKSNNNPTDKNLSAPQIFL